MLGAKQFSVLIEVLEHGHGRPQVDVRHENRTYPVMNEPFGHLDAASVVGGPEPLDDDLAASKLTVGFRSIFCAAMEDVQEPIGRRHIRLDRRLGDALVSLECLDRGSPQLRRTNLKSNRCNQRYR